MKKILITTAAAALALAACGGSDDDGGGGDPSDRIVAAFNDLLESDPELEGATVDDSCLRANLVGLPEEDLVKVADALENDTDPEGLSPETEQATVDIFGCFSFGG